MQKLALTQVFRKVLLFIQPISENLNIILADLAEKIKNFKISFAIFKQ